MEARSANLTDEMPHPIEYKSRPGTHNEGGIYKSKMIEGENCLHSANYDGHTDIASEILPKINNIKQHDDDGFTSLHLAVRKNKLDLVKLLISSGTNPNIQDTFGQNCLHSASFCGYTDIASEILPKINDINQQDNDGFTSLQLAVEANKLDVIKLLISSGSNPNIQNKIGRNCLHSASYYGHTEIASYILHKIDDVNQQDIEEFTSLQLAVEENKLDVVKLLLSSDADPYISNKLGKNCLHSAGYNGNIDIASVILPYFESINDQDNQGFAAFDYGAAKNNVIMKLWLSGGNIKVEDK